MNTSTKTNIKEASIEAVIIKADGTRVNLGVIAYHHQNPLKRAWHFVKTKITNWSK